jgi:parvulin-like peptidyl-prolyl isomerase
MTLAIALAAGAVLAGDAAESVRPVEKVIPTDRSDANAADANASDAEPVVLATVGPVVIKKQRMDSYIDALPASLPAHRMDEIREQMLNQMIHQELTKLYLSDKEVEVSEDEVEAFKMGMQAGISLLRRGLDVNMVMAMQGMSDETIAADLRLNKFGQQQMTDKKINTMIEKHPDWFNGTTVSASHILIQSAYTDATADQKAARKKLEKIAKAIEDGKITFAKAAEQYSACSSSEKGGDLGSFPFYGMDVTFAEAAFALEEDQTSDVVRSSFGFHLIKRTGGSEGTKALEGAALDRAKQIARGIIQSRIRHTIGIKSLKTYPIKR